MKTNIYIIKNTVNNKVYIGQSKDVNRRFKNHMLSNTSQTLKHKKISQDLDTYGKEVFYYEILEKDISHEESKVKELEYIMLYNSIDNGYNHSSNTNEKGHRSEQGRRNISISQMGEKNHMYGKTPANARKVRCVDTGEVFETATKCAEHYGLGVSKVCAVCRGDRKTHGKMKFEYLK